MAGYHYKLEIIPSSYSSFNEEEYWQSEQPHAEMLNSFRQLLPDNNSWGKTEEFRSKVNYSVLYIWWEGEKVRSVQFEYAPIDNGDDLLLNEVLALCKKYNYMLYSSQTKLKIVPTKSELWQDFKKCRQFKIYEKRLSEFH